LVEYNQDALFARGGCTPEILQLVVVSYCLVDRNRISMYAPEEDVSLIYQAAVPIFTKQHSSTAHFLLLLFHIVGLAAGVESILYMCQKRIHH
jgi:hypothetical protein